MLSVGDAGVLLLSRYQLYDSDSDASSVARSPPGAARSQPVVPKLCFNLGGVRSAAMSSGVSSAAASSRRGASPQTTPGGRRQSTSRSRSKARSSSHNLARVPSSLPAVPKLALGSALRRNGGGRSGVASPITPALDATSAAPVAGTGGTGLSQMEESLDFDPGCLKLHQVRTRRLAVSCCVLWFSSDGLCNGRQHCRGSLVERLDMERARSSVLAQAVSA